MNRLLLAATLLALPVSSAVDARTSAKYVRNAVPAIEAYATENGGYQGMTLADLRKLDISVRNVVVRTATRRTYCIQSTTLPVVHKAGPGAAVRTGRCGVRGTQVPFGEPVPPPVPASPGRMVAG